MRAFLQRLSLTSLLLGSSIPLGTQSFAQSIPPLQLAQPDWRPLDAAQILSLFADRTLTVDEKYEPFPGAKVRVRFIGGCAPTESFFQDGRWHRFECQRGPTTYAGHWSTEAFRGGERLCVEAAGRAKECRFVWKSASAETIFMRADASPPGDETSGDTYNPYRFVRHQL